MRFALDDDQVAFAAAARDAFAGGASWDDLAEMGVLTMLADGLDEVALVAVLEEAGRAAVGLPIVETAAVAGPFVTTGSTMATTDLGGAVVPFAVDAELFVLDGRDRLLVADAGDVDVAPVDTVDGSRRAARVRARRHREVGDRAARDLAFERGVLGTAAVLVGLAQRMLDMTVVHVRERRQFGAPVGSFQAVKHHLADAAVAVEFARPAVHRAAWSLATASADVERDVSMAKAMASDAANLVGRKALQCHGAIGYTTEYDLHRYLKRSWALARTWGDARWHRDRVGRAIGV
jgi:hypothetical protein